MDFYKEDFSNYSNIRVFPDIHGNYQVIKNYFDEYLEDENTLYIFVGDYIDRGDEPKEVIEFLLNNISKSNFIFLLGNHDVRLIRYAHKLNVDGSREFTESTLTKLPDDFEFYKRIRRIANKIKPYTYFTFHNKTYFINHAGIRKMTPNIPTSNLTGVVTQLPYEYYRTVGEEWKVNHPEVIQIFGHRNVTPCKLDDRVKINDNCYCIECNVEWGNEMSVLTIDKNNNIDTIRVKNQVVSSMANKFIQVKQFPDRGIKSISYDNRIFYKYVWKNVIIKARSYFLYINSNEMAGRGFDKFFNLNETAVSELSYYLNKVTYPVNFYKKENGFLLMVFWNKYTNTVELATKRSIDSKLTKDMYSIFNSSQLSVIRNYLQFHQDQTLLFECISDKDMIHPIKYDKNCTILLNIITNTFEYNEVQIPEEFGKYFITKKLSYQANNSQEVRDLIDDIISNWNDECEGYVLDDGNNHKLKIKTPYYRVMRSIRNSCMSGLYIEDRYEYGETELINKVAKLIFMSNYNKSFKEIRDEYTIDKVREVKNEIRF